MKNTIHRLTIAGFLLLLVLTLVPNQWVGQDARAETTQTDSGIVEVDVPVRGTFLRAIDWWPYNSPGIHEYDDELELWLETSDLYHPEEPAIVDLEANGFTENDKVIISYTAKAYYNGAWGSSIVTPSLWEDGEAPLVALFSATPDLKPIGELHRVPGAIDYGEDFTTARTIATQDWVDMADKLAGKGITVDRGGETDIPEDFLITPYSGMWLQVPRNAKYLFLCLNDSLTLDNTGSLTVTIEKDTDGDGLPDSWEQNGIDFDKDGTVDLDLPMLGADWEHKDIFVEADYMSGYAPNLLAISDVIDAFAKSPVENPDSVDGINLHVVVDETVPWKELLNVWADYYSLKNKYLGTEEERSNPNAIQAKKMTFRYCLFIDKMGFDPKCPGMAEGITCDDFILAFGAFTDGGSREDQAAVFMHELGHALGLWHGGNVKVNYKPNYLSVMNYAFEFNTWKPTRPLDYSHGSCIDLNEASLDESAGIGYSEVTVWRGPGGDLLRNSLALEIDWNNDNITDLSAKVNLNNDPDFPSPDGETLKDYNDWANLVYRFRGTRLSAASATPEDYHVELTVDQIERMREEAKDMVEVSVPEPADSGSGLPMAVIYTVAGVAAVGIVAAAVLLFRRKSSQLPGK
jgi:hypothetical protein